MSAYTKVCRETDKQLACEGEKLDRRSVMGGGILQVRTRQVDSPSTGRDKYLREGRMEPPEVASKDLQF
jgi:hypothetical protein